MRIAMVTGDDSPLLAGPRIRGGRHQRAAEFVRILAERGHEVQVYARRSRPDLPETRTPRPGVRIRHLRAGPPAPLGATAALDHIQEQAEAIAEEWSEPDAEPPDLVHALGWPSGLVALAAARATAARGHGALPLIQDGLGQRPLARRTPPAELRELAVRIRRLRALLARTCAGAIAHSAAELDLLLRLGAPRERLQLIPTGVDVDRFAPPPVPHRSASPARVLCLDGARPSGEDDGVATAVAAMRDVPGARLTVAGGPSAGTAAPEHVRYLGPVPHRTVPSLLAETDVLVSTPRQEPCGTTALEAMACGVPVVATDVGALHDLVVPQVTGLLVPPGRPDLVADALRQVLRRDTRRAALGTAAADRARSRHDWVRIASETERFYQDVLHSARDD